MAAECCRGAQKRERETGTKRTAVYWAGGALAQGGWLLLLFSGVRLPIRPFSLFKVWAGLGSFFSRLMSSATRCSLHARTGTFFSPKGFLATCVKRALSVCIGSGGALFFLVLVALVASFVSQKLLLERRHGLSRMDTTAQATSLFVCFCLCTYDA